MTKYKFNFQFQCRPTSAFSLKSPLIVIARMGAFFLAILLVHWADSFLSVFFFVLAGVAGIMILSLARTIPGCGFLTSLETSDRLAIWIVLVAMSVIGYLHNANTWVADGLFHHPQDISLWKTELILGVSLSSPLIHWLAGVFLPRTIAMNGQRFANEFALYVNFSGIALVLWTGEAALSLSTLGAAFVLMVLAELTLYASR